MPRRQIARDTERPAHPVHGPDPPVLRNESKLHVDSFAKEAAAFLRNSVAWSSLRSSGCGARCRSSSGAGHPKKSRGLLCEGEHVKFSFIAKHRGIWPADWLCGALGVSRGGFYAWLTRPRSRRAAPGNHLLGHLHEGPRQQGGHPRARRQRQGEGRNGVPC